VAFDGDGWARGTIFLAHDPDPAGSWFQIRKIEQYNRQPHDPGDEPTDPTEWVAWNNELLAHERPIVEPFPVEWALSQVNAKQMIGLLTALSTQPLEGPPRMLLPMMRDSTGKPLPSGKRPDAFYRRLAEYVTYCQEHGIAFGPRLAEDNQVTVAAVHGWVREARARGIMEEAER
jgi:hypothetical protein